MTYVVAGLLLCFLVVIARIVAAIRRAKRRTADKAKQLQLACPAADEPAGDTAAPDATDAVTDSFDITVSDLNKWNTVHAGKVVATRFPDGSVVATAISGIDSETGQVVKLRFNRDTKIEAADNRAFDRCGIGLLRLAGFEAPVRMPRTIDYGVDGKVARPAEKITSEVIISYVDGAGASSTRRISVIGFEPIGWKHKTEEVRLHAWCWQKHDYRTFNLTRVRSLMDPVTATQMDKIAWAWHAGGLRFPASDTLRAA
jgi:hypothetical protein